MKFLSVSLVVELPLLVAACHLPFDRSWDASSTTLFVCAFFFSLHREFFIRAQLNVAFDEFCGTRVYQNTNTSVSALDKRYTVERELAERRRERARERETASEWVRRRIDVAHRTDDVCV